MHLNGFFRSAPQSQDAPYDHCAMFLGIDWGAESYTELECPHCHCIHIFGERTPLPKYCLECGLEFRYR